MINKESQRRKIESRQERQKEKAQDMQGKTEEKGRNEEMYVSFREQIATKGRRKKTTEMRIAQFIYAGEISSRDPSVGS